MIITSQSGILLVTKPFIKLVPNSTREAALAVGAPTWYSTFTVFGCCAEKTGDDVGRGRRLARHALSRREGARRDAAACEATHGPGFDPSAAAPLGGRSEAPAHGQPRFAHLWLGQAVVAHGEGHKEGIVRGKLGTRGQECHNLGA